MRARSECRRLPTVQLVTTLLDATGACQDCALDLPHRSLQKSIPVTAETGAMFSWSCMESWQTARNPRCGVNQHHRQLWVQVATLQGLKSAPLPMRLLSTWTSTLCGLQPFVQPAQRSCPRFCNPDQHGAEQDFRHVRVYVYIHICTHTHRDITCLFCLQLANMGLPHLKQRERLNTT